MFSKRFTHFTLLFLAAALTASTLARPTDSGSDVGSIQLSVVNLNGKINAYPTTIPPPPTALAQASAIHGAAVEVGNALTTATNNINGPLSATDSNTIATTLAGLVSGLKASLGHLADSKPSFSQIPVGNVTRLVSSDLKVVGGAARGYGDKVSQNIDSDSADGANDAINAIEAAIQAATDVYNSP